MAIAATLAWARPATASLVVDGQGNAILGIEKKLATDDEGNPNALLFVTNIYVRFSEADDRLTFIAFSQMSTKNGSDFYQHRFGGNTSPNSNLILAFPSLAFDTFITIGLKVNPNGDTDTTSTDPDFNMGLNKIVGGWFASPTSGQGDAGNYPLNPDGTYWILIAQLTVDFEPGNGVAGSMLVLWREAVGQADQNNPGSFDNQVPAPGALALLGLAGLFGPRRRRR